jgi:ribonuclease P protein component
LARPFRLRKPSEFRRVREEGRCWSSPLLVVCKLENGLSHSRFGFSVSRRIGGAVVRNRVKRRMREAVRAQRDLVAPGWDIVLIARPRIGLAMYADVELGVARLLGVAGVLAEAQARSSERME